MTSTSLVTADFFDHINKFKEAWIKGRELAKAAKESFNAAVKSLKEQNPDWSLNKILSRIAEECDGLEGFSTRQLYRDLDDENRRLLQNNALTLSKNSVSIDDDDDDDDDDYKIPPRKEEIIEIPESPNIQVNNNNNPFEETDSYILQYRELQTTKQLLQEARMKCEELGDQVEQLKLKVLENPSTSKNKIVTKSYTLEYKDQELPLVCKFYYNTEEFVVSWDEKKAKQLRRF